MDLFHLGFLIFIGVNTYFSYQSGLTSGKYHGIRSTFQYLKSQNALKPVNQVTTFSEWSEDLKKMYTDPEQM
jgi:hypothetical protein